MTTEEQIPPQLLELVETNKPGDYASKLIAYYEPKVKAALNYEMISNPRGGPLSFDSFTAAVQLEAASNERLAKAMIAAPGSFMKAILLAAQCKLMPGGSYGLFYLIPRWNKKLRVEEVTPLIGYKGLMDLAQRHPRVHKIEAHLVYEGETFEYDAGTGKLTHKVSMMGNRDVEKVVGGYARAVITEPSSTHPVMDDPVVFVMSTEEINKVRDRSDAYRMATEKGWNNSPWHTDWKPMARKTLIRALMNSGAVPRDMGVGGAIHAEDTMAALPPSAPPEVPKVTVQSGIRQTLGIDEPPPPPFDFAEQAREAIAAAESREELEALKPRVQHFTGSDAEIVALAFEQWEDDHE